LCDRGSKVDSAIPVIRGGFFANKGQAPDLKYMDLTPALSHSEFLRADRDYEKAAVAANLVYVSDRQPGIIRKRKGKGFTYLYDSKTLKDDPEG